MKHVWTDGKEVLAINLNMGGKTTVDSPDSDSTLVLSNGYVSLNEALVLADKYMSDKRINPSMFMHSDRVESDKAPGSQVRQDEWLKAHMDDYEFDIIDVEEIDP